MPVSHILSRKEKVIRATWAWVGLLLIRPCCGRGASSPGPVLGTANPSQLLTAKHKETHALCTQMGLHVSMSPFLAFAQKGRPTTQ